MTRIESAQAALRVAREVALVRREEWLSVKEARLESMAAEIAGQLAVGACCPVCGSADHPAKATHSPGAADAALEKEALKTLDDAKATEHLRELEVRDLETRLTVLRQAAGDEQPPELRAAAEQLRAESKRLHQLAVQSDRLAAQVVEAQAAADADAELATSLATRSSATAEALSALATERGSLEAELAEALGPDADLATVLDAHVAAAEAGRAALGALAALATAEAAYSDADRELTTAATDNGFVDPAEAAKAMLAGDDLDRLAARVSYHQQRLAAVTEVLDEPGARELAASSRPTSTVSRRPTPRRCAGWPPPSLPRPPGGVASSGWPSSRQSSTRRSARGGRCATSSSSRRSSPASLKERPPTTGSRCDSPPTSSPTGSPRWWPPPTSDWPG